MIEFANEDIISNPEKSNRVGQRRKYVVNDTVWIATAILTYERYITQQYKEKSK